jgi:general secretion pathway protein G
MKIECPYCKEVSEWKDKQCPLCHKSAITPDFYRKSSKRTTGRRERDLGIATPWLLSGGGFYNIGIIFKSIPRWILILGAIAIIGSIWHASTLKPDHSVSIQRARNNMSTLYIALDAFKNDCGRFPTTEEGLSALVSAPDAEGWKGPYVFSLKDDPWKRPFFYKYDRSSIKLFSAGPDRKAETPDDILADLAQGAFIKEVQSEEIGVSIGRRALPATQTRNPNIEIRNNRNE